MKSILTPSLALTVASFTLGGLQPSLQAATVIYSEDFGGGTGDLLSVVPDVRAAIAGGSSTATWTSSSVFNANGSVEAGALSSAHAAYLPFDPQNGYIYSLKAEMKVTSSNIHWLGLGFFDNTATTSTAHNTAGVDWVVLRGAAETADNWVTSALTATGGRIANNTSSTPHVAPDSPGTDFSSFEVRLDTTGSYWKQQWFMDGNLFRTVQYDNTNPVPNIDFVGFSALNGTTTVSGSVDNFSLTLVPEPTGAIAGLLLGAGLLRRKRVR